MIFVPAYLPAILQLTPLMVGVMGACVGVLVCAVLVAGAVRRRPGRDAAKQPGAAAEEAASLPVEPGNLPLVRQEYEARPVMPIHSRDDMDLEEKNPDIIPQGTFYQIL